MRTRRILLVGIPVAVVVILGLVMLLTREREPEYGGKKLSEWVDKPNNESITAIHQIGTNAIPYLIKWIQYEMPNWKIGSYQFIDRICRRPPNLSYMRDRKQHRTDASVYVFNVLGTEAGTAIPELTRIMNERKCRLSTAARAALTLRTLNAGPEFVAGLTNRHELALMFVGGFGDDRYVLTRLLGDESRSVRDAARVALDRIIAEQSERSADGPPSAASPDVRPRPKTRHASDPRTLLRTRMSALRPGDQTVAP